MDALKEIEQALDEHHVTRDNECDPDCFCWTCEDILMKYKEKEGESDGR